MGSLTDLNTYSTGTLSVTDLRNPGITLSPVKPQSLPFTELGLTFAIARAVEITEIRNATSADVKLEVDVSDFAGTTVAWSTVPVGSTVTEVSGVYTIDGIDDIATWDIVKNPTITRTDTTAGFSYGVAIIYTTSSGEKRDSYSVGEKIAAAALTSAFTLTAGIDVVQETSSLFITKFTLAATPVA